MATLDDLKTVLDSINTNISSQGVVLSSILTSQEQTRADQERFALLARAERSQANQNAGNGGAPGGGRGGGGGGDGGGGGGRGGGGLGRSLLGGGMLGGIGLAAGGAAVGIAALGLAMPAFFGGLMAGEEGLGWLSSFGAGFDFENLKAAAVGFTDIIKEMDKESLVVLAGIMGISAVGGTKAAKGLGSMGFAISAFLGGLLAGDALFAGYSALGGGFEFSNMKSALVGFSDMFLALGDNSEKTLGVLAGIMGLSAVTGLIGKDSTGAAKALGAMGLGITGFLAGLLAGDVLFTGAKALGVDINFSSIKTVLAGFSESIDALKPPAATALAAIISAGTAIGAYTNLGGLGVGVGIFGVLTGIGAGIAGLMTGLMLGSAAIEGIKALGADGSGLVSAFKMFNDSVGALNNENAIKAMIAIIGAGVGIGTFTNLGGLGAGVGIFGVLTGIGAGIAGLMTGLMLGSAAIEGIQVLTGADGSGLVSVFKMFNDSILQITPEAITKLKELTEIGGLDLAGALGGLSAGMIALFGTGGLAQLGEGLKQGALDAIDWLFGTDYGDNNKSTIQFLVDSLDPLKDLDMTLITKMDGFGNAIQRFGASFSSLEGIDTSAASTNLSGMMTDMGSVLSMMDKLMTGGVYDTGTGPAIRLFGNTRGLIDFGPGLDNLDFSKLEDLAIGINAIRSAFSGIIPEETKNGMATVNEAGAVIPGSSAAPVLIDARDQSVNTNAPRVSTSSVAVGAGNRSDLDQLARPGGVQ